jgi:hypothetical protein
MYPFIHIFRCLACALGVSGLENRVAMSRASHPAQAFQIKLPSSPPSPLRCLRACVHFATYNVTSLRPPGEPALLEHGVGQLMHEVLLPADLAFYGI